MSKIVDFKSRAKKEAEINPPPNTDDYYGEAKIVEENGITYRHQEVDELSQEWTYAIVDQLLEADLGDDTIEYCRDQAYLQECIKSLIYRCHGLTHPFHEMIDKSIRIEEYDDGSFDAFWEGVDEEDES